MNAGSLPLDAIFNRFIDEITLTPDELSIARAGATDVAEILRPTMRPLADALADPRTDHLISGGVGKRTAIHPLPSADLLYLLPADESAIALLQETLSAAFPTMIATPRSFFGVRRHGDGNDDGLCPPDHRTPGHFFHTR